MASSLPPSLEQARIQGLPSTAYYIPNFISEEEEDSILAKVASAPKPRWKQLTHRRLQAWPSELVRDRLLHAPLPSWLRDPVVPRLQSLPLSDSNPADIFEGSPHRGPNHVLINEYPPGIGIMPHKLSARIWWRDDPSCLQMLPGMLIRQPRSLLITTECLYTDYLHGIADIDEDVNLSAEGGVVNWPLLRDPDAHADGRNVRKLRTSLTFRDVVKVSTMGTKLPMLAR
ncbi:hypothetical protein RJ55_03008 [Drechmeria coniospora]|nr:hypothetical protein RJ55_03008 [Drechmeria coniospora]